MCTAPHIGVAHQARFHSIACSCHWWSRTCRRAAARGTCRGARRDTRGPNCAAFGRHGGARAHPGEALGGRARATASRGRPWVACVRLRAGARPSRIRRSTPLRRANPDHAAFAVEAALRALVPRKVERACLRSIPGDRQTTVAWRKRALVAPRLPSSGCLRLGAALQPGVGQSWARERPRGMGAPALRACTAREAQLPHAYQRCRARSLLAECPGASLGAFGGLLLPGRCGLGARACCSLGPRGLAGSIAMGFTVAHRRRLAVNQDLLVLHRSSPCFALPLALLASSLPCTHVGTAPVIWLRRLRLS
mmetsp:Transcript_110533/g.276793  ORF Transcript_110533/g.276793 Transcript_110533/m.276793 type:complete len:308 (+) Transcript_110533:638-1561(+)